MKQQLLKEQVQRQIAFKDTLANQALEGLQTLIYDHRKFSKMDKRGGLTKKPFNMYFK